MIRVDALDIDATVRNWPGTVIISGRYRKIQFAHVVFLRFIALVRSAFVAQLCPGPPSDQSH